MYCQHFVPNEDPAVSLDFLKKAYECERNVQVELLPLSYILPRSLPSPLLFTLTEEANENDDSLMVIPDYSQLRALSARTLRPLDDVNTKLYIGTEVKYS